MFFFLFIHNPAISFLQFRRQSPLINPFYTEFLSKVSSKDALKLDPTHDFNTQQRSETLGRFDDRDSPPVHGLFSLAVEFRGKPSDVKGPWRTEKILSLDAHRNGCTAFIIA